MPEVQTGASAAIDFLSGFGKGMVQADVNRRENEKLDMQKQKWQQEMTAYAAQDELRKMQLQNSQLEIDMRKTQFDDIVASREQTKGFVAFMADAIGKVKGSPAEKQSQLLEAYMVGGTQFSQADRSIGDKIIDIYSKIHQSSAVKAWKIADVKNFETGKKQRAVIDEAGNVINFIPGGAENLEIVNETIASGIAMHQKEFDTKLQSFLAGKSAVLGAEGQSLNIDDFMKSVENLDGRDKSRVTMDWIFDVHDRLWLDIHKTAGTLDQRLDKMLTPIVDLKESREALVKPYRASDHTSDLEAIVGNFPIDRQLETIAAMKQEFENLLPVHELPAIERELARLQNKTTLKMRDVGVGKTKTRAEQLSMAEQVAKSNRQKEKELLKKFVGYSEPEGVAEKGDVGNWWDDFLGKGQPETYPEYHEREAAYDTLRRMQEKGLVK